MTRKMLRFFRVGELEREARYMTPKMLRISGVGELEMEAR